MSISDIFRTKKKLDKIGLARVLTYWFKENNKFIKDIDRTFTKLGLNIYSFDRNKLINQLTYFDMWLTEINCQGAFKDSKKLKLYLDFFYNMVWETMFSDKLDLESYLSEISNIYSGYDKALKLAMKKKNNLFLAQEFYKNVTGKYPKDTSIDWDIRLTLFISGEMECVCNGLGTILKEYRI